MEDSTLRGFKVNRQTARFWIHLPMASLHIRNRTSSSHCSSSPPPPILFYISQTQKQYVKGRSVPYRILHHCCYHRCLHLVFPVVCSLLAPDRRRWSNGASQTCKANRPRLQKCLPALEGQEVICHKCKFVTPTVHLKCSYEGSQ